MNILLWAFVVVSGAAWFNGQPTWDHNWSGGPLKPGCHWRVESTRLRLRIDTGPDAVVLCWHREGLTK